MSALRTKPQLKAQWLFFSPLGVSTSKTIRQITLPHPGRIVQQEDYSLGRNVRDLSAISFAPDRMRLSSNCVFWATHTC